MGGAPCRDIYSSQPTASIRQSSALPCSPHVSARLEPSLSKPCRAMLQPLPPASSSATWRATRPATLGSPSQSRRPAQAAGALLSSPNQPSAASRAACGQNGSKPDTRPNCHRRHGLKMSPPKRVQTVTAETGQNCHRRNGATSAVIAEGLPC